MVTFTAALDAFGCLDVEAHHFDRGRQVRRGLAAEGLRGPKVPELLIAAVAEAASLTVLHYDADVGHIAAVAGRSTRWVVERGSIDCRDSSLSEDGPRGGRETPVTSGHPRPTTFTREPVLSWDATR